MVSRTLVPAFAAEMHSSSASPLPPSLRPSVVLQVPPRQQSESPHSSHSSVEYLLQIDFFRDLAPSEISQVAGAMVRVPCLPKQVLCREGEPIARMFLVDSGWVKTTKLSASGEEVIVGLSGPGTFVTGLGLRPGAPSPSTAQVLESGHVLVWDAHKLENFCERFPVLRRNAANILAERLSRLEQRFHELATEQVPARLASLLLQLGGQLGSRVGGAVRICLSREELAQMTGTTLFTVSRLLSQWHERGIVHARRRAVFILDLSILLTIAQAWGAP